MTRRVIPKAPPIWRQYVVLALVFTGFGVMGFQVMRLQTVELEHLRSQGDKRHLREVRIAPERGRIMDRNGKILSVSTPVDSVAADPGLFCQSRDSWKSMVNLIDLSEDGLQRACKKYADGGFMYIKRRLPPALAADVMALEVPGLELRREYKRFYPGGPVGAHLIGFTDVDDRGQEGLELVYNELLSGNEGRKRVLKDLAGHYVESVESIQRVRHGQDLAISIDQRAQSLASHYLEAAVKKHDASGGSVVVIAIPSGEIVSMVTSPQFNPNDRDSLKHGVFRNRAVTDVLEPGSTLKPFTVAMALESGEVTAQTMIDTTPGTLRVGGHTISDVHDYGEISVFDVVVHSSNVGSAKLALSLPFDDLFTTFEKIGFGRPAAALPGEISGVLQQRTRPIEHATMAYGYGLSVTPLQLARAYTALATDGRLLPVTLEVRKPGYAPQGRRVFDPQTVAVIRQMLEHVATPEGTARKARFPRYRVGGKTGTTHKLIDGNYVNKRYISLFAGMAPISNPRFVMVVAIDDPGGQFHYGGDVAAPVFSNLMSDLMRLYNVEPDGLEDPDLAAADGVAGRLAWQTMMNEGSYE